VSEGILDSYDLKGSVALELRFAEGARATKDIDIGVPVERKKRLYGHFRMPSRWASTTSPFS